MAVDLQEIKNEYISTKISMRKLSEKHTVPIDTIKKAAAKEGWTNERAKIAPRLHQKTVQKVIEKAATKEANRIVNLMTIGDEIAIKLERAVAELGEVYITKRKTYRDVETEDGNKERVEETQDIATHGEAIVDPASIRALSATLKNLRDVAQAGKDATEAAGGITIAFGRGDAWEAAE